QRRLAQQANGGSSGSSGANQRALADELEKAARQLQQLTRDQQRPDGNEALARLRDAQQKLERNQAGRSERDLQRAQHQAEELANEQKDVASDVNALDQAGANRAAKAQSLAQRKDAMDAKVADLQKQLEELANQMRRDEKDAARKLDEAAGSIRDK